jgi:DNA-binding NarL/FixJ family response regulator
MRIVIAEDSALLRAGIERILTDAGHEVVAGVPDATNLLRLVNEKRPDLAIVDVRMPPISPTKESGPRRCCAVRIPSRRCWCCRTTSRSATPPN